MTLLTSEIEPTAMHPLITKFIEADNRVCADLLFQNKSEFNNYLDIIEKINGIAQVSYNSLISIVNFLALVDFSNFEKITDYAEKNLLSLQELELIALSFKDNPNLDLDLILQIFDELIKLDKKKYFLLLKNYLVKIDNEYLTKFLLHLTFHKQHTNASTFQTTLDILVFQQQLFKNNLDENLAVEANVAHEINQILNFYGLANLPLNNFFYTENILFQLQRLAGVDKECVKKYLKTVITTPHFITAIDALVTLEKFSAELVSSEYLEDCLEIHPYYLILIHNCLDTNNILNAENLLTFVYQFTNQTDKHFIICNAVLFLPLLQLLERERWALDINDNYVICLPKFLDEFQASACFNENNFRVLAQTSVPRLSLRVMKCLNYFSSEENLTFQQHPNFLELFNNEKISDWILINKPKNALIIHLLLKLLNYSYSRSSFYTIFFQIFKLYQDNHEALQLLYNSPFFLPNQDGDEYLLSLNSIARFYLNCYELVNISGCFQYCFENFAYMSLQQINFCNFIAEHYPSSYQDCIEQKTYNFPRDILTRLHNLLIDHKNLKVEIDIKFLLLHPAIIVSLFSLETEWKKNNVINQFALTTVIELLRQENNDLPYVKELLANIDVLATNAYCTKNANNIYEPPITPISPSQLSEVNKPIYSKRAAAQKNYFNSSFFIKLSTGLMLATGIVVFLAGLLLMQPHLIIAGTSLGLVSAALLIVDSGNSFFCRASEKVEPSSCLLNLI